MAAFSDRNSLFGLPDMLEQANEAGIRLVFSAELVAGGQSVFTFVKNEQGWQRLCALLSEIDRSEKTGDQAGGSLNLLTALEGENDGLILATEDLVAATALSRAGAHCYLALAPGRLGGIVQARRRGLPLLALDDASFLEPVDRKIEALLRAIATGSTLGRLEDGEIRPKNQGEFLSKSEFCAALASWPEALENRKRLIEACTYNSLFNGWHFPQVKDAKNRLRDQVYAGAQRRYGELNEGVVERIEYELSVIGDMGFSDYFLVIEDIVKMASRSCGRGSGAASIVAYSLGITNVDPIAHRLYFERFLNRARKDPPDLDVDFAWDERDEIIRRVIDKYGREHCARVANHIFFRPQSALRETARALGYGDIPRPLPKELVELAAGLEGLPRGLSMHCGGLVITADAIQKHAPILTSNEGYPLLAWDKEGAEAAGLVKIDLLGNRSLAVVRDCLANLGTGAPDEKIWRPAEDAATQQALAQGNTMGVFYIESPAMRQLQKKTGRGDFEHIVIHSSIIRPAANRFIAEYVRRLKGGPYQGLDSRLDKLLGESYGILCYQEDVSRVARALAGFDEAEADALRKLIAKKAGGEKLAHWERRFYEGCRQRKVAASSLDEIWAMMLSFDGYSFCKPHSASYAMLSFQSAWLRVHHPAEFMAAVISNGGGYYRTGAYVSEARRMGLQVLGPDINISDSSWRGQNAELVVGLVAVKGLGELTAAAIVRERSIRGRYQNIADVGRRLSISRDELAALCEAGVFDSLAQGLARSDQLRQLLFSRPPVSPDSRLSVPPDSRLSVQPDSRLSVPPQADFLFPETSISKISPSVGLKQSAQRSAKELHAEFRRLSFLREFHPLQLYTRQLQGFSRCLAADVLARPQQYRAQKLVLAAWPVSQKELWTSGGQVMSFISFEDESALYETVFFPDVYRQYGQLLSPGRAQEGSGFGRPLLLLARLALDEGVPILEAEALRPL